MRRLLPLAIVLSALAIALITIELVAPVAAEGALVTSGEFDTFQAGTNLGFDISGHATMVRVPSGKTIVTVHVTGLESNTTYPTHVHNAPCSSGGGGHYQHVEGGPVNSINEIWPVVTSNAAGVGTGKAKNDFIARTPDSGQTAAVSVVIHYNENTAIRLACADLE